MYTCLVTGGLGYIGSHICIELLENNYTIIIMDNLSNSKIETLDTLKKYNHSNNEIYFFECDLVDYDTLDANIQSLSCVKIDVIIHLAGLKAVSESIDQPIKYYENNITSTLNITKIMEKYSIHNIIFSSSSTVYGSAKVPYYEHTQTGIGITNPYGRSKYIQEEMLKDICNKNKDWNVIILRYFNPIGHLNNDIKENPNGIPNNLFPYVLKVYEGQLKELVVFGSDYDTRDGTCSRDFIHVVDLANAHKTCCDSLLNHKIRQLHIYNVGTGKDTTVLELIHAFERQNNTMLPYRLGSRRQGDLQTSYSNVDLIYNDLGWKSTHSIEDCVNVL